MRSLKSTELFIEVVFLRLSQSDLAMLGLQEEILGLGSEDGSERVGPLALSRGIFRPKKAVEP